MVHQGRPSSLRDLGDHEVEKKGVLKVRELDVLVRSTWPSWDGTVHRKQENKKRVGGAFVNPSHPFVSPFHQASSGLAIVFCHRKVRWSSLGLMPGP